MNSHISHKLTPSFWGPYITSFKLFFSQPLLFFGMALAYAVFMVLQLTSIKLFGETGLIVGLVSIVSVVIWLLFYIVFVVVSLKVVNGKKVDVKNDVKYPFTRFKEYVALTARCIWYVVKRPLPILIFALVSFALLNTFGANQNNPLLFKIMSLLSPILGLIAVVWLMIRSLRTSFVYYVFVAEKADSKVALEHGVDLMKGNWWLVFFFILGFMLFTAILFGVITGFLTILIPSAQIMLYISAFFQSVITLVMILFFAQLYYSFIEYKK